MTPASQYGVTKDRLKNYGLFSDETIDTVSKIAADQAARKTYAELFESLGVSSPRLHTDAKGNGVFYVDVAALQKPEEGTIVLHLPMANPLDPNQLFQVATIVAAHPNYRVIAFGNPSNKPYYHRSQNLNMSARFAVAFKKDKSPLVVAEQDYLRAHEVTNIYHIGFSYGSLKALVSYGATPRHIRRGVVSFEPVAHPRGIVQLARDFQRSFSPLGAYVDRTGTEIYKQARHDSVVSGWQNRAYVRMINIAVAMMLAKTDFISLLRRTLKSDPEARAVVAWAVKSELGNDAHLKTTTDALIIENPGQLTTFRLSDDYHAFANDIYLHAALIKESMAALK